MKTKIKYLLITIMLIVVGEIKGQVGMNGNNPDKSAVLDLNTTNKGLLIPRISLNSTISAFPVMSPATSLLVYNLNPAISGLGANGAGYYYWEDAIWKKIASSSEIVGDNLGNHLATKVLDMGGNNITNINNADVGFSLKIFDRLKSNSEKFELFKNNGNFGIWNSKKAENALSIAEATSKTTLVSAAISKGVDGVAPIVGAYATSADSNGNIIWKAPSVASPVGTAFFKYTIYEDTSINSSSGKVKFNKEIVDKSNITNKLIDNTTKNYSVFIAPKTGFYQITACVYQYYSDSSAFVTFGVMKGSISIIDESSGIAIGTSELFMYTNQPYFWGNQLVTAVYKLNAGDKVSVGFSNNFNLKTGSVAPTIIAGDTAHPSLSYFTGYFLSEE